MALREIALLIAYLLQVGLSQLRYLDFLEE
jgi:hypothetical protein